MKIRLMGSADLVRAWARELEKSYGIKGAEYPSRYGNGEVRMYFDLDDRQAATIVGLTATMTAAPASTPTVPPRRKRLARFKP